MAEPENMVLILLREMRARMDARFDDVEARFGQMDARFDQQDERFDEFRRELARKVEVIRQAAFAESILGRYAVNEVEDRLSEIERRLATLESRS